MAGVLTPTAMGRDGEGEQRFTRPWAGLETSPVKREIGHLGLGLAAQYQGASSAVRGRAREWRIRPHGASCSSGQAASRPFLPLGAMRLRNERPPSRAEIGPMDRGMPPDANRNCAIDPREPGHGRALRCTRSRTHDAISQLPRDGVPTPHPILALASGRSLYFWLLLDVPVLRTTGHCLAPNRCNARRSANQRRGDLPRTCWQRSLTTRPPHS
jgi:hypothetical protein